MHDFIKGPNDQPNGPSGFARDVITNDVNLHQNCDKIEAMVRHCEPGDVVKLSPPDSQGLVTLMNAGGKWRGHIERMYWGVSPAVLEGVVNQVRTALIN